MIDWLRRSGSDAPQLELAGRTLPLAIRRTAAARRMTLRLAADGSAVRITVPRWGRTAEAIAFAARHIAWLEGQLAALPAPVVLADGARLCCAGEPLVLRHDPAWPRRIACAAGELRVGGPAEGLERRLRRWLEAQARAVLAADLAHYCARAGRAVPALALSNARRRWGSCAHDGAIRINWRLIMAPAAVRRSVVAHEVAHLAHFDHSPRFHAELAALFEGDLAAANRWLKREGRSLYAPFG